MIINIIKLVLRNILHNKTVSTLNIVGLSLGLATSFVILLYILHEVQWDCYHEKKDRLFRIITEDHKFDTKSSSTPFILAPTLKDEIPEIEQVSRIYNLRVQIKKDDSFQKVIHFKSVDPALLDMFSINMVAGNRETTLIDPYSVILSKKIADYYFPDSDALNKVITIKLDGQQHQLTINGIFKDIPEKSTFKANFITQIHQAKGHIENYWSKHYEDPCSNWALATIDTYILLNEKSNFDDLRQNLLALSGKYSDNDRPYTYFLQPLKNIYLHSNHLINNKLLRGNIKNLYIFSTIAAVLLLMSAVNFILLSTARTTQRTKEFGMRKVLGANRFAITLQVIGESLVMSVVALPIAVTLTLIFLPIFNTYLGFDLSLFDFNSSFFIGVGILTILLGVLPGLYISSRLSKLKPILTLNPRFAGAYGKSKLWKSLIGFQLVIFISLITNSITIYRQLQYTKNIDMGFNKDNLILIDDSPRNEFIRKYGFSLSNIESFASKLEIYKNEILNNPNIISASAVSYIPPTGHSTMAPMFVYQEPDEQVIIEFIYADKDFIETLQLKVVKGESFIDQSRVYRENTFLVNETAEKMLGIKDMTSYDENLIGIVKDFHLHSIYDKIPPICIALNNKYNGNLIIKTSPEKLSNTIQFLDTKWDDIFPDISFKYSFFDSYVEQLYSSDFDFEKIIRLFTSITILIACIGLLGLSLFISERRLNEIGIRKVLGATALDIIQLLYREFIVVILVSTILSVPIVIYTIGGWLHEFEYQVSLNSISFIISSLIAISIIFLTLGFKIINASLTNPVKILRYE